MEGSNLHESLERRYELIFKTINEWVWETDQRGNMIYTSPRCMDMLGYEPEEVVGMNATDFLVEEDKERAAKLLIEHGMNKTSFNTLRFTHLNRDGKELIIEINGSPNLDDGGNFLGFIGTGRDVTDMVKAENEIREKLEIISSQQDAIRELSTPIMEVWDDVLVLPIVGVVDTKRSMDIMNSLLDKIVESQSRCVILDVTGVEIVDTRTADYLLKVVQASRLLGAYCVLTGINPAVAQTLVDIGANLSAVKTLRNLKEGLVDCIAHLRGVRGRSLEGKHGQNYTNN